jgi:eukaryotic-like serine/threonine-protein kinase
LSAAEHASLPGIPRPGEIFDGKCRIERVLGIGGMGVVLAAMHLHLQRRVAVKLLLPEVARDLDVVARFLQEGRAAARMRSEHVAHVYDVATSHERGEPYMIMEYLDGQNLDEVLESRQSLGVEESVDYVLEACEAVAEAHSKGIIHRDLKPANLFLAQREDGTTCVKVLDFGISKLLNDPSIDGPKMNITKTRSILGSPAYMSPEQLRASKHVDARADIWALGVILYELLAGAPPFDGQTIAELGAQVLAGEVPPLRGRVVVPPELGNAILRCLRKNRDERFESVADLVDAIAQFGTGRALSSAARILSMRPPGSNRSLAANSPRPSSNSVSAAESGHDVTQYATGPRLPSESESESWRGVSTGPRLISSPSASHGSDTSRRTGRRYVLAIATPAFFVLLAVIGGVAWRGSRRGPAPATTTTTTTTMTAISTAITPPPPASADPVPSAPPDAPVVPIASADPPKSPPAKIAAAPPPAVVKHPIPPRVSAEPTASPHPAPPPVTTTKPASDRFQ